MEMISKGPDTQGFSGCWEGFKAQGRLKCFCHAGQANLGLGYREGAVRSSPPQGGFLE